MRLSIVVPSFNQARFLKACLDSILNQNYSDVEVLVMDGGSTDESVSILKSYGDRIIWVSEPDGGQAAGVNKGINRASGEVIGWLNSDDVYYPGVFKTVMKVFEEHPEINVIYGHADHINEDGSYREDYYTEPWDYERLKEICYICQPAVFFRRKTVMEVGLLNPERQFAMDYDLWLRLGKTEQFHFIKKKFAGSRLYPQNKTLGSVEKVHIDIMDTVKEVTGHVPERWLEGSANAVERSRNGNPDTPTAARRFRQNTCRLIDSYVRKYSENENRDLQRFPYSCSFIRTGIDASMALQKNRSGVGNVALALASGLCANDPKSEYIIYPCFEDHFDTDCMLPGILDKYDNAVWAFRNPGQYAVEQLAQTFRLRDVESVEALCQYPDVMLYPSFTFCKVLSKTCPSVYVLYDLSFLEHHEYSTDANYEYCYRHLFNAALVSDYFLSISEYTKRIFLQYFPFVEESRIRVIPLACSEIYFNEPDNNEYNNAKWNLKEPFWLSVGTVEPRKNMIKLIDACAILKKKGVNLPLYIAGGSGWKNNNVYERVRTLGLEQEVHFLGYVSDEELNLLYHSCRAMIYPSLYEGFGIPILEAMAAGAPVICSNTTSMPEVGGEAVLYIDPVDANSIAEQMMKVNRDDDLRSKLSLTGSNRAKMFDWKDAINITRRTIVDAVTYPRV